MKITRVARTIAELARTENIEDAAIDEAIAWTKEATKSRSVGV